jgi:DNA-binding MarR family transcriptional regulator
MVELLSSVPRPMRPPPQPFEVDVARVIDYWAAAAKLRQRLNRLLRPYGVTFSQWRMIHATAVMVRETGDMVSQLDIRRRARLDATTASRLTFKLGREGWLDWGLDCYGYAFRIFATEKAKLMLAETRPLVAELVGVVEGRVAPPPEIS